MNYSSDELETSGATKKCKAGKEKVNTKVCKKVCSKSNKRDSKTGLCIRVSKKSKSIKKSGEKKNTSKKQTKTSKKEKK